MVPPTRRGAGRREADISVADLVARRQPPLSSTPLLSLATLDPRTKFLLVVGFLVVCVVSLPALPTMSPWGFDLHNVHAFEQCAVGQSPYNADPAACGDALARPFYYPPLLFAFFRWLRHLTLETAMYVWTIFTYAAFAAMFFVWSGRLAGARPHGRERHELVTFCVLLLFQYPFVFAVERGNTDVVAILLYTLSAGLFMRGRVGLAGLAAGLAAGFRLSPGVAVFVMTGALAFAWRRVGRWTWLRYGGCSLLAFALSFLIFFRESRIYLHEVLPKYAHTLSYTCEYCHSIPTYVGDTYRNYAKLLGAALLLPWIWAGGRALSRGEVGVALAGALAVSTYVQGTSFDYNLISTYPLLLLLFVRAQRTNRWTLLAFGLFTIAGDRRLFSAPGATLLTPSLHVALQLAFLVIAALVAAGSDEDRELGPAHAHAHV
jgi:hypothetical protein